MRFDPQRPTKVTVLTGFYRGESLFSIIAIRDYPRNFLGTNRRSTMPLALRIEGASHMGNRVTPPSGGEDYARARRLKNAAPTAVPAAPVQPVSLRADSSCSVPPKFVAGPNSRISEEIRYEFLEQVFQASPDALVTLDRQEQILWANRQFENMFGYSRSEYLGQSLQLLRAPADDADLPRSLNALDSSVQQPVDIKCKRKDGTLIDVLFSCTTLTHKGRAEGYCARYHDISDRKRVEALSAALYRVAEQSTSARDLQEFFAAVHGIVNELLYARNFYVALYDPATDLLSFPYFVDEHDSPPSPKKPGRGLTEFLIRTGEPLLATPEVLQAMEDRGEVARNGSRSLDWMGVPLKVGNHTFGALVVQTYSKNIRYGARDQEILTFVARQLASAAEIKRNEQALRRSEARYRSLVQSSVYGIYRSSLDGRFLDVNPELIAMLGYASAEEVLLLDPARDVFARPEEHSQLVDQFRRTGRLDGAEVKWRRKDGTVITVRVSGRAVSGISPDASSGPADALEAIAEDITERRMLEDQFRQAQKMEAVGRLAGGVAHDFNNLLMVISGYTEVILAKIDVDSPLHEKGRAIQQAADRATTLTRQLLAFSRKQLLELKVVDVNTIVEDMERLLRPLIGENVELVTSLAKDAGHTRADAGQLEQVLMNLVVNAKDAMPSGGKLTIRTRKVNEHEGHRSGPTFIRPGSYVQLSVSDTGTGMDKETQSRIFEPFFTTKEIGKGTGLGLSTVYGIVKQTGGYVVVQSEEGCGSTFHIYLPRVEQASERSASPALATAAGGTETILLVEDEESVRHLVRETLISKGYKVLEAENGEDGLAKADNHPGTIDLVITDVVMPGLGGREMVQQMIQERPTTKVLYLSGYTEESVVSQDAADHVAFLQKPFTLQNLSRKIREILGGSAAAASAGT